MILKYSRFQMTVNVGVRITCVIIFTYAVNLFRTNRR